MRETHIGVVFLVGDHAYKMKKPVTTAGVTCPRSGAWPAGS